MLHAVIMAGGSGTRFWPESRRARPKQFLNLAGDRTLLQETADRCHPLIQPERTWVVTNERLAPDTREQLPDVPADNILIEPCARNTAPCIGLAAIHLLRRDPDAVMAVLPADHVIQPADVFRDAVQDAVRLVEQNSRRLVLFGVPPNYPATGYGYIERGAALDASHQPDARARGAQVLDDSDPSLALRAGVETAGEATTAYHVATFREKPDPGTAQQYVNSGRFYWNCGIFVWRADRILQALASHLPRTAALLQEMAAHVNTPTWTDALARTFPQAESVSIDVAVLERESDCTVIEAPFAWDDVGSWLAMARLHGADDNGNTILGLHRGINTRGCIIRTGDDHLVATIGIENCIIVHTPDATLVARKDDENSIRKLIELLQEQGDDRFL
jgi:mannose-1-phosphate guanylyltransferase